MVKFVSGLDCVAEPPVPPSLHGYERTDDGSEGKEVTRHRGIIKRLDEHRCNGDYQ